MDELRAVLELATDEELRDLGELMFARKFNPLDYLTLPELGELHGRDRPEKIDAIEQRFRFLAADGFTVLRGATEAVSYHDVLLRVCGHLKIDHRQDWTVAELEAEIFLFLLERTWERLPRKEQLVLTHNVQRSLSRLTPTQPLPAALLRDPVRLVLQGSSAIALSTVVRPIVLQHIAYQFALHLARYQAARAGLAAGGSLTTALGHRVTAHLARSGMAASAATYGAARTALAVLGPALWAWFLADLGWRAIATNYSRIIPAVFALAQIRLTRGEDTGSGSGADWGDWGDETLCYA